jgi:hypothetical protein
MCCPQAGESAVVFVFPCLRGCICEKVSLHLLLQIPLISHCSTIQPVHHSLTLLFVSPPFPSAFIFPHSSAHIFFSLIKYIEPIPLDEDGQPLDDPSRASAKELRELVETLSDTQVRPWYASAVCLPLEISVHEWDGVYELCVWLKCPLPHSVHVSQCDRHACYHPSKLVTHTHTRTHTHSCVLHCAHSQQAAWCQSVAAWTRGAP